MVLSLPNSDDLPVMHDFRVNFITISVTDVYRALVSFDVEKSGMDKISLRVLRGYAEAHCEPLHHLFS